MPVAVFQEFDHSLVSVVTVEHVPLAKGLVSTRTRSPVVLIVESVTQTFSFGPRRPHIAGRPPLLHVVEPAAWFTLLSVISFGAPPPSLSSTNQHRRGS